MLKFKKKGGGKVFKDWAHYRGYKILETSETIIEELEEISAHYEAIKERVEETYPSWSEDQKWLLKDCELKLGIEWFPLSILGLYLSAKFIELQMRDFLKLEEIEILPPRMRVVGVAFNLLLWLELQKKDLDRFGGKSFVLDQKERLVLLITTLINKGVVDQRIFGVVKLANSENPNYFMNFINDIAERVVGVRIEKT